jgi:hypothetical protein
MLPLLREGDQVLVAHGHAGVRRGDVVVFRREGQMVAHRVLRVVDGETGPTFVTKGDNAPDLDPPLGADEIVGRVLAIRRGEWQMSLNTPAWRVLGLLIAVATLVWRKLYGWTRDLKRRFLGPEPNRLTALLRQVLLSLASLFLRVAQAILSRWKAL